MKIILNKSNSNIKNSLSGKFRQKRFIFFKQLISNLQQNYLTILDVGGTENFWERMNFIKPNIDITLLNTYKIQTHNENINIVVGDARDMHNFQDQSFDIVFSNSVIEHVGNFDNQLQMANEITRIGKNYFVQTPNYYFPIEPHFHFIYFQLLPINVRVFLIQHFDLGFIKKIPNRKKAIEKVNEIRLINRNELKRLFPNAMIYNENIFYLTKSFIAYNGFNTDDTHPNF